jgi:hypothetical protein
MTGMRASLLHTVARGALASCTALAAEGCVSAERAQPAEPRDPFEVLSTADAPAGTTVAAAELEPVAVGRATWEDVESGARFEVRTEPAAVPACTVRTDPADERTLRRAADGAVSLVSQRDRADGAVTAFDPPLELAPPALAAGAERHVESRASVTRRAGGSSDGGSATRTVRLAAVDRVRTPLGTFDAPRVDARFELDVPFARLTRQTSTWIRPGDGPVAVRSEERILVMGIVPRQRRSIRVRLPDGASATPGPAPTPAVEPAR